jgi:glycerol-3-phosphate dehydrogenase
MNTDKPHVLIIGAGFTGCATAHDLALRGCKVTVIERGEIASGTSGRTHGLLHSGGRYCVTDQEAAIECIDENILLRQISHQFIEFNGGLFIALTEEDLAFASSFEAGANACHIPIERLTPAQALKLEPGINPNLLLAYTVPDGSFDPLRLALAFAATAKHNGAQFFPFHEARNLLVSGQGNVKGARVMDRHTGSAYDLQADLIINATGAWAGQAIGDYGKSVPVIPTPGVMVAYDQRLIDRVVNRLAPPGDGDILIPQRRMVVIGTTSYEVQDPDYIPVLDDQVEEMYRQAVFLVPGVQKTQMRGAYMSARPLIGSTTAGRSLSRTFKCYDHKAMDNLDGLITITGGKATTCRAMAEKTSDLACQKLGISASCQTRQVPLVSYREYYRS